MRCPIVTWRKLKIISVAATALAFIATLCRRARCSGRAPALAAQFRLPPAHFLLGLRDRCKYLSHEHGRPPDAPNADDNLSFPIAKTLEAAINLIASQGRIRPGGLDPAAAQPGRTTP